MVTHTYLQSLSKDISKYTDPGYLVNLRCYRAFKWDCECGRSFVCRWRPVKTLPIAFLSHLDWYFSRLPPFFFIFLDILLFQVASKFANVWKVGEKWSLLTTVFEKGGRKRKSGFAALGKLEQISLGTVCAKSLNCWQSSWKYSNWLSELYIRSQRSKEPKHSKHVFKVHKNMNNYLAALAAPLLVWKIFQYFLFNFFRYWSRLRA